MVLIRFLYFVCFKTIKTTLRKTVKDRLIQTNLNFYVDVLICVFNIHTPFTPETKKYYFSSFYHKYIDI